MSSDLMPSGRMPSGRMPTGRVPTGPFDLFKRTQPIYETSSLDGWMDGWMVGALPTGNVARHALCRTVPFAASTRAAFPFLLRLRSIPPPPGYIPSLLAVDDRIGSMSLGQLRIDGSPPLSLSPAYLSFSLNRRPYRIRFLSTLFRSRFAIFIPRLL